MSLFSLDNDYLSDNNNYKQHFALATMIKMVDIITCMLMLICKNPRRPSRNPCNKILTIFNSSNHDSNDP
jgi:hypothetical protein